MFVTETISIDTDKLVNMITLDDLISLRGTKILGYGFSSIVCNLIIMKKLSDYLKLHPQTNLYTLSLSDLISRIKSRCLDVFDYRSFDGALLKEYKTFIKKFDGFGEMDDYLVLFYADRAIEKLEMELI